MSMVGALIEISGGNIRNHHIYLGDASSLFPKSVVGGKNTSEAAKEELSVEFVPGSTIRTDIAGDKMIFRNRAAVREFFEVAGVVEGDRILVEIVAASTLRVSKISR